MKKILLLIILMMSCTISAFASKNPPDDRGCNTGKSSAAKRKRCNSSTLTPHTAKKARTCHELHFYESSQPFYEFANFFNHAVFYKGKKFATTEHYFQWKKFEDTQDPDLIKIRDLIQQSSRPREAFDYAKGNSSNSTELFKGAHQKVTAQLQKIGWHNGLKDQVMSEALALKFRGTLGSVLLATDGYSIVEASPYDDYWGYGKNKRGKNKLGQLLDQRREDLFNENPTQETTQLSQHTINQLKKMGRWAYFKYLETCNNSNQLPLCFKEWKDQVGHKITATPASTTHSITRRDVSHALHGVVNFRVAVDKTKSGNLSLYTQTEADARTLVHLLQQKYRATGHYAADNGPHGCKYRPVSDLPFRVSVDASEVRGILNGLGFSAQQITNFGKTMHINGF
ncbi:MAG: NADAR family protein [Candidatus Nucleicultricaceae bacterium]